MTEAEDIPEADAVPGAPHPRHALRLFGQDAAETEFLNAVASGRLHHAWLLTGPRGIGKATLAWRMARHLLAGPGGGHFGPPTSLDSDPTDPLTYRVAALSESRLCLLRRPFTDKTSRLAQVIPVDEVRRLKSFLGLTAADGGARVVIVDSIDDMNRSAANALLKVLEEPPSRTYILLVSHRPARLLPTIRSRCRTLRLNPLSAADLGAALDQAGVEGIDDIDRLAALADGSAAAAVALVTGNGLALQSALEALATSAPGLPRDGVTELAEKAAGRGADADFDHLVRLTEDMAGRLARKGLGLDPGGPEDPALLSRLSPGPHAARIWAEFGPAAAARARAARSVNLDPATIILDMLIAFDRAAARAAPNA